MPGITPGRCALIWSRCACVCAAGMRPIPRSAVAFTERWRIPAGGCAPATSGRHWPWSRAPKERRTAGQERGASSRRRLRSEQTRSSSRRWSVSHHATAQAV